MAAGPADSALDTFKELVFDALVRLLISRIIALAGWLSFGPVSFIISQVVTYVANQLYELLRDQINFQYIMLRNDKFHAEYVKASLELQAAFDKLGKDSKEYRELRDAHKKALSEFVRYHDA